MLDKVDFDGILFDIIEVEKNHKIKIQSSCHDLSNYYNEYIYTLIKLRISNLNNCTYSLLDMNFKLVDNESNQYSTEDVSYVISDLIFKDGYIDNARNIMPNGKIKTILIFPKLTKDLEPQFLYYNDHVYISKLESLAIQGHIKINLTDNSIETNASKKHIKELNDRKDQEKQIREEEYRKHQEELAQKRIEYDKMQSERMRKQRIEQEYKVSKKIEKEYIKHKNKIDSLEVLIYSRLNNVLTYKELTKIENSIMNLILEIKNMGVQDEELKSKFLALELEYYNSIPCESDDFVDFDEKYSVANMTPKEFELYTFEKFKNMGYSPVLTSEFLDEGIDIILTKDNIKYGVQCKYFNPNRYVGTDIVLHFLGALVNIDADYGFLVTTGKITKAAQYISDRNKIQIIKLTI